MNAPRKKKVVALPDSPELTGWTGAVKKHANTALTVLLLAAAVFWFVRSRIKAAEAAKESIAIELGNARTMVQEFQPTKLPLYFPAEMIKHVTSLQNDANTAITSVLNSSDATVPMRAEALMLRGDLYWQLANLPPLPGSTTQPSLQLTESSDALLQKASDAYQEVIKNSTYADQHEQLAGSHLGLAAIAENRGDFKTAEAELKLVENDNSTLSVLQNEAKIQLAELPEIQKKMYLAPANGVGPAVMGPTTQFTVPPVLPAATQAVVPALPAVPVPTVAVPPTTLPSFKP